MIYFYFFFLKIQDTNRELGSKLKEKDGQLLRLKEVNKELRRINKNSNVQDKASLRTDLEEVKTQLEHRDKEFKVNYLNNFRKIP